MTTTDDTIHVLHVDDDPELADLAATLLEREDDRFDVRTASDPAAGLEAIASHDVDCVVSDYDMPGQNGIEFLDAVRERDPDLPFILYPGKGSEAVASDAISSGVTDYLQKQSGTDQYTILANRVGNAVERYRAEREARETRARLRAISESSTDAIVVVDADSRVQFANPAVETHFGYDPASLRGELLTTLMPERYRERHLAAIDRYLETGERSLNWSNVEFPGQHRDGTEMPLSVSFSEFRQDGERRFLGIIRDVSEQTHLETEFREREERFRQLAENIEEVVWMTDPDKRDLFYANPAYEEIWGQPVDTLYDDPTSFLDAVHPEDRERVEAALDTQGTDAYDEEYRIVRPDGDLRWVRDRAVPVRNDAGEVYRVVGVASDITELKERERQLLRARDLLEQAERTADVGGWEIDTDTTEVFWTANLFDILGVEDDEEPPLEEALDLYHEDDRPVVEQAVEGALESGEPFDVEARLQRPDGETRWLRVYGTPTVEDGRVVALRGAVQDVTEQKRHQRRLERQNARLEQFASVVSHDLRNPLHVAQARVELAQLECESEHLEHATRAHDRMTALIDDVLTLAREGEEVGDFEPVTLANVAQDGWESVATAAATLVTETERTLEADRSRLQQLLENLFRNAVEHGSTSPDSQARRDAVEHAGEGVTVTVGDLPDGFYVEDDGPGIPAEDRSRVFEAGYSTADDGTGFGLSIVEQVAEAHGWEVALTEGSEGGARFEVTGVTFVAH